MFTIMKFNMKEIWKDVKGYEGLYRISNYGNVLGVKRQKLLKPIDNISGENKYLVIGLKGIKPYKNRLLSHLVYEHFKGSVIGMIDYLDGDYNNCRVDNLIDVNKTYKYKKKKCKRVLDAKTMKIYESISELSRDIGISTSGLYKALNRNDKKYSRYKIIDK